MSVFQFKEIDPRLANYLPSENIFDQPHFDIVKWVNTSFPTAASLEGTKGQLDIVRSNITKLDEDIIYAVSQDSKKSLKGTEELKKGKQSIQTLFTKMRELKKKSTQLEDMVKDICRDIQDLDLAKKNLTTTINVTNELITIVTETEKLRLSIENRQYKDMHNHIHSVVSAFDYFDEYKHLPQILYLQRKFNNVTLKIREQIFADFQRLDKNLTDQEVTNLSHACFVVNTFEKAVKKEFISLFCDRQFSVYYKNFGPGNPDSSLENIHIRYTWCKNLINHYQENYSRLFPPIWHVAEHLVLYFCKKIRQFFEEEFKRKDSERTLKQLYSSYRKNFVLAKRYEEEMCKQFPEADEIERNEDEIIILTDDNRQSEIFKGKITRVFLELIKIYTDYHEGIITDYLESAFQKEDWNGIGGLSTSTEKKEHNILQSSGSMVLLFSRNIDKVKEFDQGKLFAHLFIIFQKGLSAYAGKLREKLQEFEIKVNRGLSEEQLRTICVILNTSYYLMKQTKEMENSFQTMVMLEYKSEIVGQPTVDIYDGILIQCLRILRNYISIKLTNDSPMVPTLRTIVTTDWVKIQRVADHSEYINSVGRELMDSINLLRTVVAEDHLPYLCDSITRAVIQLFQTQIDQIKGISEIGAEQLLVDAGSLKDILVALQLLGDKENLKVKKDKITKRLEKEMTPVLNMIKLLMTRTELLAETFKAMFGEEANAVLFNKILQIRGIPYAQQGALLEQYKQLSRPKKEAVTPINQSAPTLPSNLKSQILSPPNRK